MEKSEKNSSRQKQKKLKDKLKENNAVTKSLSVIFLILILAGLFTFIIIGLHSLNLLVIPEFLQNIIYGRDADEQVQSDNSGIYDVLGSDRTETGGFGVEISLETVRGIISVINLPDNLYLETAAKYYMGGELARTAEMSLWKKENKYKYIINSDGGEIYINNGVLEFTEDLLTGNVQTRRANPNFNFANIPHISDINYYLDLIENGQIVDYYINRKIDGNIIEITYKIDELDQHEIIWISLETGLVMNVWSYVGDILFYESATSVLEAYFTGEAPGDTVLTDNIFAIG